MTDTFQQGIVMATKQKETIDEIREAFGTILTNKKLISDMMIQSGSKSVSKLIEVLQDCEEQHRELLRQGSLHRLRGMLMQLDLAPEDLLDVIEEPEKVLKEKRRKEAEKDPISKTKTKSKTKSESESESESKKQTYFFVTNDGNSKTGEFPPVGRIAKDEEGDPEAFFAWARKANPEKDRPALVRSYFLGVSSGGSMSFEGIEPLKAEYDEYLKSLKSSETPESSESSETPSA